MMTTDSDKLSEALRTASIPEGLGVPAHQVLRQAHRARQRHTAIRSAAAALAVVGLAGAGVWGNALLPAPQEGVSPAGESQELVTDPDVSVYDIYDMSWEEQLAAQAESMGIQNPPEVEVIRQVTPAEADQLLTECLAGKGWVSTERTYTVPTEQESAFNLDVYRCTAAYPVDHGPKPTSTE